jgi:hypothetical protein
MRSAASPVSLPPMFGKINLMRDGAEVLGRVTESGSDMSFATGGQGYHVKARVEFDDGATSEISCRVPRGLGAYGVGAVLPFRYDPKDRSKIGLDEPALEAIADATRAKVKEIEREKAERPIPPGAVPGMSPATATAIALEKMSQIEGRHNSGALTDAEYEAQLESIRAETRRQLG